MRKAPDHLFRGDVPQLCCVGVIKEQDMASIRAGQHGGAIAGQGAQHGADGLSGLRVPEAMLTELRAVYPAGDPAAVTTEFRLFCTGDRLIKPADSGHAVRLWTPDT